MGDAYFVHDIGIALTGTRGSLERGDVGEDEAVVRDAVQDLREDRVADDARIYSVWFQRHSVVLHLPDRRSDDSLPSPLELGREAHGDEHSGVAREGREELNVVGWVHATGLHGQECKA